MEYPAWEKSGELLTNFRDLARGSRLDTKSEAAVRQIADNLASAEQKVKLGKQKKNVSPGGYTENTGDTEKKTGDLGPHHRFPRHSVIIRTYP